MGAWCDAGDRHDSHANMNKQAKQISSDSVAACTPSTGTNTAAFHDDTTGAVWPDDANTNTK